MNRVTRALAVALVLLAGSRIYAATVSVNLSTPIHLLPNTANQLVAIPISGPDTNVVGSDFYAMIGDGGPELSAWGFNAGTKAPRLAALPGDLNITGTGTIFSGQQQQDAFAGNGPPGPDFGSLPQAFAYSTNTTSPSIVVSDSGTWAILHIDTTGLTSGSWPLALNDFALGGTDSVDVVLKGSPLPTIVPVQVNGVPGYAPLGYGGYQYTAGTVGELVITPIPEPTTFVLASSGLTVAVLWMIGGLRRKRR